jgi:hypothetical protein
MNDLIPTNSGLQKGPFFSQKGAIPATIIMVVLTIAVLIGLNYALPWLINLFQNLVIMVGSLIAAIVSIALGFIFVLCLPKLYKTLLLKAQLMSQKLMQNVVEADPIGVQELGYKKMSEQRAEMGDAIQKFAGGKAVIENAVKVNQQKLQDAADKWNAGQKMVAKDPDNTELRDACTVQERQVGRLQASNDKMAPIVAQLTAVYAAFKNMYSKTKYMLEDLRNEIDTNKVEYAAVKESSATIAAASKFFNQNGYDAEAFRMATDFIRDDIANRVGKVDDFMGNINDILLSIDLKNGVMEDKGQVLLQQMQNQSFDYLLKPIPKVTDQAKIIAQSRVSNGDQSEQPKTLQIDSYQKAENSGSASSKFGNLL